MTRMIDALTAADWTRLDNEFDALLELAPNEQQRRLAAMAPADAALLRRLLAEEADDTRLHHHLESALRFLAKQESLASGTELGPWRIVRPIGRGGMAEVYLAERADGAFERQVALKVLWPGLVTPGAEEQVRQERQILANLEDPRIADLVDGGVSHDGRPWLAMERVEGRPITEACRDRPLKDRVALLIQVAEAVASAHRQLVVHGDIKPSNVLVTEAGEVRLLDFGIGRLLGGGSGDTAGRSDPGGAPGGAPGRPRWRALTPSSSSPEQRAGHPPTPSSDIYQLGLLMGAVLEGARRGSARKGHELAAIEGRATAAAPKDRYAGADRFAADLSAFDAQRPVAALEGGATYRLRCFARRRWGALTASALVLTLAVGAVAYQLHQTEQLAKRNAANEAMLAYLEKLLERDNPKRAARTGPPGASLLDDAAAELSARLALEPEARARVLTALGRIHQGRSELVVAGRRFSAAIEIAREHQLSNALEEALEGLAVAGSWSGDYKRSEALLRELLSVREAKGSPPKVIDKTRLELADLLHSRGKYRPALEIANAAHESGSDAGWSSRILGMIHRDFGEFETAEALFAQAHTFELRRDPVARTRVAELSDHHAVLAIYQGDVPAAAKALATSAELRRSYLGEDWDGLVWHRHWNALRALAQGDGAEAASLLDRMLQDYERFLGESSHLLAFARSDRAWAALRQGDVDYARTLFALARTRLESMQEDAHPRLAEVLLGQSLVALTKGQPEMATQLSGRALSIRRRALSDGDGAKRWRENACRVHRWAGGACVEPPAPEPEEAPMLDTARLVYAARRLCPAWVTGCPDELSTR